MGTTVESQATSETIESRVKEVIELIRPAIQADGGDGVVTVVLLGTCESCPISPVTLKQGVERILRERIPGITEVIALEA